MIRTAITAVVTAVVLVAAPAVVLAEDPPAPVAVPDDVPPSSGTAPAATPPADVVVIYPDEFGNCDILGPNEVQAPECPDQQRPTPSAWPCNVLGPTDAPCPTDPEVWIVHPDSTGWCNMIPGPGIPPTAVLVPGDDCPTEPVLVPPAPAGHIACVGDEIDCVDGWLPTTVDTDDVAHVWVPWARVR